MIDFLIHLVIHQTVYMEMSGWLTEFHCNIIVEFFL